MLKKLAISLSLYLVSPFSTSFGLDQDLSKQDSLVFRFTGFEAQKLNNFLKERLHRETDFSQIRFHGDTMSLACNEQNDCYLWLARKEWQYDRNTAAASTVLTFTLPVKQTTLSGRLSLTNSAALSQSKIQLQLQDFYFPGSYAFTQPLNCPTVKGTSEAGPLRGDGDCRLELSGSPKKSLPYASSVQFIHNLDNIILNFKGPWAKKLFNSASSSETDPHDPMRMRAQLGPTTYCWNLDPLDQDRYLLDAYVCQTNLLRQNGKGINFTSQGAMKNDGDFSLSLKPVFENGLLKDFDLTLQTAGNSWMITHCPNFAKSAGFGQCTLFYDLKMDSGLYPIGNSIQGVAVGWGVIKPKE